MKNILLTLSAAACVMTCNASEPATTAATNKKPLAGATLYRAGYLPDMPKYTTGSGFTFSVGIHEEYYVLCGQRREDAQQKCLRIVPTYLMQGVSVRADIALDGESPVVWFEQSENLTPDATDKQSVAIGVFNQRFWDVLDQFSATTSSATGHTNTTMRASREVRTSPQKKGSGNSADTSDPYPGSGIAPRTGNNQTVEVPGERPDPEYPPPYDPLPPPDMSPPDTPDPGAGGDNPGDESPDGSRYKPMALNCAPVPGRPALACVYIPGKRPPPLVDPSDPPPNETPTIPPMDWCKVLGIGCTGGQNPPMPPHDPTPKRAMCASYAMMNITFCVQRRLLNFATRDDEEKCVAVQYANLGKCLQQADWPNPVVSPVGQ